MDKASKKKVCCICGKTVLAINMAKHRKTATCQAIAREDDEMELRKVRRYIEDLKEDFNGLKREIDSE
jgi:hypothetical protein